MPRPLDEVLEENWRYSGSTQPNRESFGWGDRFGSAIDSAQAGLYGVAEAAGSDWAGQQRRENQALSERTRGRAAQDTRAPTAYKDVRGVGDAARYVGGLAVDTAPQMAAIAAGAIAGGPWGAAAASYPFNVGDILQNQREQAGRTNMPAALGLAIPYTAADTLFGVEAAIARGQLPRNAIKQLDNISGLKGGLARAGSSALVTAGKEGASETFQEGMNQFGRMTVDPDETFYNEKSADRFGESAVGGAALGGVFGGAGGGWRRSRAYEPTRTVDDGAMDLTARATEQPTGKPLGLSYNPLAGVPRVFPDGTVVLGSEQELDARYPNRAPGAGELALTDYRPGAPAPQRQIQTPDWETSQGAAPVGEDGLPYTRDILTGGLALRAPIDRPTADMFGGEARLPVQPARPDFDLQSPDASHVNQQELDFGAQSLPPYEPPTPRGAQRGVPGQLPFSGNTGSPKGQILQGLVESLAAEGHLEGGADVQASTLIAQGKFAAAKKIVDQALKEKAASDSLIAKAAKIEEQADASATGTTGAGASNAPASQRVQQGAGDGNVTGVQPAGPVAAAPVPGGAQAAAPVQPNAKPPASLIPTEQVVVAADEAKDIHEYEQSLDELYRRWRDDGDEAAANYFEANKGVPGFAADYTRVRERAGDSGVKPQSEGKRGLKLGRSAKATVSRVSKETDEVLRGLATPKFQLKAGTGRGANAQRTARIQAYLDAVVGQWVNRPAVKVLDSIVAEGTPTWLTQEYRAMLDRDGESQVPVGLYNQDDNTIYVFADQVEDSAEATETVFHEGLGHFGLRGVFGKALVPVLDALAKARPDLIRAKAREYGLNLQDQAQRLEAAEEVLAELAETRPNLTWVKQAIAAIRTWLRENVKLFANLEVSDAEIIRDYIVPARDWVERGKAMRSAEINLTEQGGPRPAPLAAKARPEDLNDRPMQLKESAFDKWFAGSKVVDAAGEPLRMYHGTSKDTDFSAFKIGQRGAWFTDNPEGASSYAESNDSQKSTYSGGVFTDKNTASRVMPVWLSIKNPYTLTSEDERILRTEGSYAASQRLVFTRVKAAGHDGIDMGHGIWVAFHPEQIKSAIGNNGNYSPDSGNIRFKTKQSPADQAVADSFARVPYAKTSLGQRVQDALFNLRESPWALKWTTNDQIAEGYKHLKPVLDINRATGRMAAVANRYLETAAQTAKKWRALPDEVQLEMQKVMLKSTMAESHVAIKGADGKYLTAEEAWASPLNEHIEKTPAIRAEFGRLYQQWNALPAPAKQVYDQVRDDLTRQHEDTLKALRKTVADQYAGQLKRALTDDELQKLANSDAGVRAAFKDTLDIAGSKSELRALEGLYTALRDVNSDFGTIKGPYFPLVRFGDHVVVMKAQSMLDLELAANGLRTELQTAMENAPAVSDEQAEAHDAKVADLRSRYNRALEQVNAAKQDEKKYVVEFHETPAQAERARQALAAKNPGADVYRSVKEQYYRGLDGASPAFLKNLQETLAAALDTGDGVTADAKATALQSVKDMYMRRQPERSALRAELKRMSIEGVQDAQMLRGYAQAARNGAWRVSRLLHAGEVTSGLAALSEDRRSPDAKHVLNELKARFVGDIAPPEDNKVLQALTAGTYFMHLGFNLSYFATNATQAWVTSLPVMGGRHGIVNSANSLMAASKDVIKLLSQATTKSIEENGAVVGMQLRLTDEQINSLARDEGEAAMLKTLTDDGVIDITIKHDLGAISDGSTKSIPGKVLELSSALANFPELYNRLSTALAAYRMEVARREGANESNAQVQERAEKYAEYIINRTHFNYSPENAPRMMRGQLGRLVFQFKRYQQGMIYLFAKLVKDASNGDKDAMRSLAYLLGMTVAVGGVVSLPIAAPVALAAKIVAAMYPDDDEPEWMTQWYNGMKDGVGETIAQMMAKGLPTLAGLDLSGKLGQGNLLNPVAFANTDGKKVFSKDYMTEVGFSLLGPSAAMLGNEAEAVGAAKNGDFLKAAEKGMPTFVANAIKAYRRAEDGLTTRNGDTLMEPDEFSALSTGLKAMGFESAKVSDMYQNRSSFMQMMQNRTEARKGLLREYYEATKSGDGERVQEARDAINAFNERQPADKVKSSDLAASIKQHMNRARETRGGLHVGKRDADTYRRLQGDD